MRILDSTSTSFPSPLDWDRFVAQDPRGHLLQTHAWGELKAAFGWVPVRLGIEQDGSLVAGAQILYRRLGPLTLGYLPKGPVLLQQDDRTLEALAGAMHRCSRRMRAINLTVEPEWYDGEPAYHGLLARWGMRPDAQCIQPRRTIIVDLAPEPERILARMKAKWRYNIHLSARKGVQVREGALDDLDTLYALMRTTGERDRFAIHSLEYYRQALALFAPQGRVQLLLAYYEGEALAALVAYAFNRQAWYMYGASSNVHRELMPNHQLQWRAMQWARDSGCLQYDLWGIPDTAEGSPTESLQGVQRFKEGFGGCIVRYVGAYDYVYRPLLHGLLRKAWTLRAGR